jgi:hypothetical protein
MSVIPASFSLRFPELEFVGPREPRHFLMICRFGLLFFLEFAGRSGEVNLASSVKVFAKVLGLDLEKENFYS